MLLNSTCVPQTVTLCAARKQKWGVCPPGSLEVKALRQSLPLAAWLGSGLGFLASALRNRGHRYLFWVLLFLLQGACSKQAFSSFSKRLHAMPQPWTASGRVPDCSRGVAQAKKWSGSDPVLAIPHWCRETSSSPSSLPVAWRTSAPTRAESCRQQEEAASGTDPTHAGTSLEEAARAAP